MKEETFEQLWASQKKQILSRNAEYQRIVNSYQMRSGADWLLFALPLVGAIVAFDYLPFKNEILNWIVSAIIAIVLFCLVVALKSWLNGDRSLAEVEAEVKQQCFETWKKTGKLT